jgi:archaellum component FlaF (FlaF/FlaG flagellin family)
MTPKGYTTRQDIQNYLLIDIDQSFYAQVDDWIAEIEAYINQQTGRNFVADSVASSRYYDGNNSNSLLIDDAVEITELNIGGSVMNKDSDPVLADGDYVLYPFNQLPITKICLRGSVFPASPMQCIKITAKWGFSAAVPADIKQIATVLVAGIINYSWKAEGEIKQETVGTYSVTYKDKKEWQDFDLTNEILQKYIKMGF